MSSRGRSATSPSTSGRSTSIVSTRTWGSSCPSSPRRSFAGASTAGALVDDPFAGSGTTLVEANALGIRAIGADVSAFNCLLMRVKVGRHDMPALRRDLDQALAAPPADPPRLRLARALVCAALRSATWRGSVPPSRDRPSPRPSWWWPLGPPARRASPPTTTSTCRARPVRDPYACHKHRRTCRPVERADHFLRRYAADTVQRLAEFDAVRTAASVAVEHADARTIELPERIDGIVTSPPYPGLIDYHEQHRYAYELLGLDDRRELELGAAAAGTARKAIAAYCEGIAEALARARPRAQPRRDGRDRRERPPRPLRRDRAAGGVRDRPPRHAAREPPHRPPRRRVLRADPLASAAQAETGRPGRLTARPARPAKSRSVRWSCSESSPVLAITRTPATPMPPKIGIAVVTTPSRRVAHGIRRAMAASARCCQTSSP